MNKERRSCRRSGAPCNGALWELVLGPGTCKTIVTVACVTLHSIASTRKRDHAEQTVTAQHIQYGDQTELGPSSSRGRTGCSGSQDKSTGRSVTQCPPSRRQGTKHTNQETNSGINSNQSGNWACAAPEQKMNIRNWRLFLIQDQWLTVVHLIHRHHGSPKRREYGLGYTQGITSFYCAEEGPLGIKSRAPELLHPETTPVKPLCMLRCTLSSDLHGPPSPGFSKATKISLALPMRLSYPCDIPRHPSFAALLHTRHVPQLGSCPQLSGALCLQRAATCGKKGRGKKTSAERRRNIVICKPPSGALQPPPSPADENR